MTHPFHAHRQSKVEHGRVGHITRGYASGGAVHSDEAEDRAMVKRMVKPGALKADGEHSKHRADRPHRARGGHVKGKGKGKGGATVNVIVASGGQHPGMAGPMPPPAAMPAPAPAMAGPPRPPMAPPMPPGGAPVPGMPMGPRRSGGRAYAKGGRVSDGPAWKEGVRSGTQVQHSPGKSDTKDMHRGKPVTYARGGSVETPYISDTGKSFSGAKRARGGPIYAPEGAHEGMGPNFDAGSGGGHARIAKLKRVARKFHGPLPGSPTS